MPRGVYKHPYHSNETIEKQRRAYYKWSGLPDPQADSHLYKDHPEGQEVAEPFVDKNLQKIGLLKLKESLARLP